jgi:hypothetical protein
MTDIIKSLEHHSQLANKYMDLYDKARRESDGLQVVVKHIILSLKGGYLTEELIEAFLDLPQISDEAIKYIYDYNRTTTKGNEKGSEHQPEGTCSQE